MTFLGFGKEKPTEELQVPASQVRSVVQGLGQELKDAADALDLAAAKLKNIQGQGLAANHVKMAAMKARRAAQGVL